MRGVEPALLRRIDALARADDVSRGQAALRLLMAGAGLDQRGRRREIGDALDRFIGTWTRAQERAFRKATAPFSEIDRALWS